MSDRYVCQICSEQKWIINDKLSELREYHGGTLKINSAIIPIISVTCKSCGNIYLLNALVIEELDLYLEGIENG
jgi:RNase P subunit RPR2